MSNLLFGVVHSMKKKAKKIIYKGFVFFCSIFLVFSLGCKKAVTVSVPLTAESDLEETVRDLLEKTRALQWEGEYDEAYDSYSNAIRMSPQDASLYFERGNISFLRLASLIGGSSLSSDEGDKLSPYDASLLAQRYCGLALYDFNEAISLAPQIDIFYYMRGSLHLLEVSPCYNTMVATENFDKAIELNPSNAVYYMERGKACISLGRYKQAADDLRKAAAIKGHDYQFYHDIGKLFEKMGMKKEALSFYKQAMEQAPHDRLEILSRSLVLLRGGNNTDLIHDYTELIAKRPEIAQLYAMRGRCYSESEKFQEAIKDYSVVIGLQPDNKEIYMSRGLLFDRLGKKREGQQDFQTACKLGYAKACSTLNTKITGVTTDTKKETLRNTNIPEDTVVKIGIAEAGALKDAKPIKNTGNTENVVPWRPDPPDGWVPFWHSASDNTQYFYSMIKKTENNNMVRVRVEQRDYSQVANKEPLQEQKIDSSKSYTIEFWSLDCHLSNASMMGRYSSDPQIVTSRSPYTHARQGALFVSPAGMIDELWKIVCGGKERVTTNHMP